MCRPDLCNNFFFLSLLVSLSTVLHLFSLFLSYWRKKQKSGLKRKSTPETSSIPEKVKKGSKTVISDLTFSSQSSSKELKVAIEKVHRTPKDSQQTSVSHSRSLPTFQTNLPGPSKHLSSASKLELKRGKQSKRRKQEEEAEEEETEINITPNSLRSYSRTHPYRFQSIDYYAPRRLSKGGISVVFETSPGRVSIPESQSLPSVSGLGSSKTEEKGNSDISKSSKGPKHNLGSDTSVKGEAPTTSGVQTRRQSEPTSSSGKSKRKASASTSPASSKGKSSTSKGEFPGWPFILQLLTIDTIRMYRLFIVQICISGMKWNSVCFSRMVFSGCVFFLYWDHLWPKYELCRELCSTIAVQLWWIS